MSLEGYTDDGTVECHKKERDNITRFLDDTDEVLKDLSDEASYFVDYIWDSTNIDKNKILDIANMNDYWGQNVNRSYICIENIEVNTNNFKVMKSNTLKYILPDVDIIQFGGSEDEIELFTGNNTIRINAICKCCVNEWNGNINPQLQMIDYEIVECKKNNGINAWGF